MFSLDVSAHIGWSCDSVFQYVPDGKRNLVDRAAYMSYLETQLERVTASCNTVQVSPSDDTHPAFRE